jgi:dipeptidyl-peptidase 4
MTKFATVLKDWRLHSAGALRARHANRFEETTPFRTIATLKSLLLIIASSSSVLVSSLHAFAAPQATSVHPSVTVETNVSQLTIDRIFASTEFQDERFGQITWSQTTSSFFTFKPAKSTIGGIRGRDLVRVDCESGTETVIASSEMLVTAGKKTPIAIDGFSFSNDESKVLIYTNSQRVWRQNTRGDYWLLDLATREFKQLGGEAAPATMMFAKFSPDANQIAYVRENNIYVQQLSDLRITPLTTDGSPTLINGTSDWVNEEELDLRDCVRWSPDSKSIAFWQFDTTGVPEFTMIDNTSAKYSQTIRFAYPKVGEQNSAGRVGVVRIANRNASNVQWLEVTGDPREHYVARLEWMPDSEQLILQQFNRLQNANRVMVANAKTGATKLILTETDETWLENENPVQWIKPGEEFLWISERDGWRHAYKASIETGKIECLTPGNLDVIEVEALDAKNGVLYFAASPENATQRYLYRVPLSGGEAQRLTPRDQPGTHAYDVAANNAFAVHTFSNFQSPPVSELIRLSDHSVVRELTTNRVLKENLAKLTLPSIEFLNVDIGQGTPLDAWCIKPKDFDPGQKYPLLFHVYGEPHGQTVKDAWQGPRGLWHWMMAQRGYIVASVDNRGTMSPRGRAWRKCVHRQIGILASQDQAAAARALLDHWPFVDRNRVGIWGWSGGGSMSLNAIFRYPDLYQTAVAVAPVPNQLLYDTIYQERYMGLPEDNAAGYRDGSPITFAKQLKGDLLLIHGTGDDNCHYQGVELLMNELIMHNKPFSVMPYPGRSHSISEGANTTRHFYALLARFLDEHVRAKRIDARTE